MINQGKNSPQTLKIS